MGGQHRQVPLRWSFCHVATGIESRTVALAVEGAVRFRRKRALAMRANGGKREKLIAPANHEKPLVTQIIVNPVRGVVAGRTGIYDSAPVCAWSAAIIGSLATPGHARGQNQKLSAG